jgi:acetophenone carboxylase
MAHGDAHIPTDVYELVKDRTITGDYEFTTNLRAAQAFKEGDIFVGCSHGGVGYGDVLERDPRSVVRDVRREIISDWVARNVYHVVYDPVTFTVDQDETRKRRAAARKERIRKGLKHDEFQREWRTLKPAQSILSYFGPWPDTVLHNNRDNP